ncbi:MAG: type II restriction endonuclease [Kiritimatiellia bacterium]
MDDKVSKAVALIQQGHKAFFKFIAANETGETGGHQCGFYVPKSYFEEVFERPCVRGANQDQQVKVYWNDDQVTESRFVYYGAGTRNEARITNFGRGFEFLKAEYTGALVVFIKESDTRFHAYVFNSEEEIEGFLGGLGLGPTDANRPIQIEMADSTTQESRAFADYIKALNGRCPSSVEMSAEARKIEGLVYDHADYVRANPDKKLLSWSEVEYRLFRAIESHRYGYLVSQGFTSLGKFLELANTILNSRKSRAGKSLEHHLAALFSGNDIQFVAQMVTEGNKRPDFIFPSSEAYHDATFDDERLVFLAAKTTCKDRWRQILTEADRFEGKTKYLCTLQQGMTTRQIDEMSAEQVTLVVPKPYIGYYPRNRQSEIVTIAEFIQRVREVQS